MRQTEKFPPPSRDVPYHQSPPTIRCSPLLSSQRPGPRVPWRRRQLGPRCWSCWPRRSKASSRPWLSRCWWRCCCCCQPPSSCSRHQSWTFCWGKEKVSIDANFSLNWHACLAPKFRLDAVLDSPTEVCPMILSVEASIVDVVVTVSYFFSFTWVKNWAKVFTSLFLDGLAAFLSLSLSLSLSPHTHTMGQLSTVQGYNSITAMPAQQEEEL